MSDKLKYPDLVGGKALWNSEHQLAIDQEGLNGFELSWNPDDGRFYVHDRNEYGDLETRATFRGTLKGLQNARMYMKTHEPRGEGVRVRAPKTPAELRQYGVTRRTQGGLPL